MSYIICAKTIAHLVLISLRHSRPQSSSLLRMTDAVSHVIKDKSSGVENDVFQLQIIFCSCVTGTTLSREKWQMASLSCQEVIKI